MKLKRIILSAVAVLLFANGFAQKATKYYLADWESLKNYEVPEWYYDAKFGIWTHWGVYSVPAFRGNHAGEWYPRWMYLVEDEKKPFSDYEMKGAATAKHHVETYGTPDKFAYHDFIPMWKAEKWNPDAWAQLGIDCGAKFFTITGMHHDGFALYDSEYTPWNAMDMGPKRDLVGDLAKAVRKKGLKFGISNHFAHNRPYYDFMFKNGFHKEFFEKDPSLKLLYSDGNRDLNHIQRWWEITTEMAEKYDPDLYYFDWGWNTSFWDKERPEFCSFFYNHAIRNGVGEYGKPEVVINYKNSSAALGSAVLDLERASMSKIQENVWQTDESISDHSWGYSEDDTFKSAKGLIAMLMDITSKNGILMLNLGPKADGTFPQDVQDRLLEMGKWLKINGEAVYATRPWKVAGEGPTNTAIEGASEHFKYNDIRFTQSKDGSAVYVTIFGLPKDKLTLNVTKVNCLCEGAKVTMLSNNKSIKFKVNKKKQLVLDLSKITEKNAGCDYAYSFKIEKIQMDGVELDDVAMADIYIHDMPDHVSLPGSYTSEFPYISAVNPVFDKAHRGVKRDKNYANGTIKLDGVEYEHGLLICPVSGNDQGVFIIKTEGLPAFKGISAKVGIEDAIKTSGSSEFIVEAYLKGEWKQLFKSKVLRGSDKAVDVDVDIPQNTEFIRLVTTGGGDGCSADHAVWADLKFTN